MYAENSIPDGYMQDSAGNLISIDNIRPIDLARHELVLEKIAEVEAMHEKLKVLKAGLLDDIEAFVALSFERYNVKLGGKKGNLSLESFDGKYTIERQMGEYITFDEGLLAAKTLIDECLRDWTNGSGSELKTLIDHTFRVDKKGKLNTSAILGLRRHKFDDERWKRAMDAISESVKVTSRRAYVRAYKKDENGNPVAISLDIATL